MTPSTGGLQLVASAASRAAPKEWVKTLGPVNGQFEQSNEPVVIPAGMASISIVSLQTVSVRQAGGHSCPVTVASEIEIVVGTIKILLGPADSWIHEFRPGVSFNEELNVYIHQGYANIATAVATVAA